MNGPGVWWVAVAMAVAGAAGCQAGPSPEEEARRMGEIDRQGEDITQAMDQLEDRLLADQASLLLWQELAQRHRRVSAVVTRNQLEHFSAMVELMGQQEEKARKLRRRHLVEAESEGGGELEEAPRPGRAIFSRASAPGASRARN